MSVSTESPPSAPPPRPGPWSRRDPLFLAAAGLVVIVLGFGLAALIAHQRAANERPAELLSEQPQVSGGAVTAIGPLTGTDLGQYLTDRLNARPVRLVFDWLSDVFGSNNPWFSDEFRLNNPPSIYDAGFRKMFNLEGADSPR